MIESAFMDYGVLGLLVALLIGAIRYLVLRDEKRDTKLEILISNNTEALTIFNNNMKQITEHLKK